MKHTPPTKENRGKIHDSFKKTFKYRRYLVVKGGESVTEILETFPRIKDMPDLIRLEFNLLYTEQADNFLSKWPLFRDAVIKLGRKENNAIKELVEMFEKSNGNGDLCGLIVLSYMLHRSTSRKKGEQQGASRAGAIDHFYQCKPVGTLAESEAEKDKKFKQPFLMGFGTYENPQQLFVILDYTAVDAGCNILRAFDLLFKSFYTFQVEYPSTLHPFWEFIDSVIYEVMKPAAAKPHVREVASSVRVLMAE